MMIQENKANEVSDLLKEHYSFSPTLTRQVLSLEQFQNQVVDEKFCCEVIKYVYENKLVMVDRQKVALGKQDEGFYKTFGIFVYTKPTELTGETKYFKIANPSRPTKWVDFNNEEFVFTEENNNLLEFIINDEVDDSEYYIISEYLTKKLWEINKIGRVGYGRNFIFSYNAMMNLITVLKLNSEYFVEYKSYNVKKFVDNI